MIKRYFTPTPATAPPPATDEAAKPAVAAPPPIVRPLGKDEVFIFPATLAQRRFWLLDKLHPGGNPALNMPVPLRLRGALDLSAMQQAWREVISRHEALRTTFVSDRGELRQLIAPRIEVDLPLQIMTDAPIEPLLRDDAHRPFDLETGPLIRGRLVRISQTDHLLLINLHHIVSDGWSNGILVRELCTAYSTLVKNTPIAWSETPLQFADYADWQHERLAANDFAWQRKYWRQQLSGDLPVLDLPTDRPRLKSRNATGDLRSRVLPPEMVAAAKALATSEGGSPFMLFMAIFQVLLHRYTGQEDFLITTPSANRQRQELESLVGLFVNPLLLRADLRDDPSFRELLHRVRRISLEGFTNQDIPFELLLDEFQPRHLQVNFLYQASFFEPMQLADGLHIEPLNCVSPGTVHELSASAFEEGNSVRLEFEYDTALFDANTIDRMLGHYETLLAGALANPAQNISALPLLTAAERRQFGLDDPPEAALAPPLDIRGPLLDRVMAKTDAMIARHGKRELSCAELLARMESARNSDRSERPPSDLDQGAAWVAHWRARVETPPPSVVARSAATDAAFAAASTALCDFMAARPDERIASFSRPGAAATEELGAAVLSGALLVYPTPELLDEPVAAILAWLERENIAIAFMPAVLWNRITCALGRKIVKPTGLRLVIATEGNAYEGTFGRIAAAEQDSRTPGVRVCSRTVIETACGTVALDRRPFPAAKRLQVVHERSLEPLPIGVPGDLAFAEATDSLVPLGEVARWRPDGSLERMGPSAAQHFAQGFRVHPRRTEAALRSLEGIRHVLLRPFPAAHGTAFVAYLLAEPNATPIPGDATLRQLLREKQLPDHAVPAAFIRLKEIPIRTVDGRLDLDALPPPPSGPVGNTPEPVRPYLGLQLQLIAIWEEVLGVRGIGIRDDFFDLGGNSLLAMRILQRTEAACGKVIPPAALFSNPTIEHLAGVLAREVIQDAPAILHVHDAGKRTPFFYLHGDLSGGGFYSLKLSRALGPDQPFYVMPPQDVRTLPGSPTIEEMAARHLAALRAARPHGPYVIGGFCVAGLIAYELAQQLRAAGEQVEMLLIIDAAPDDRIFRSCRSLSVAVGKILGWDDAAQVAHFESWVASRARLELWRKLSYREQRRVIARRFSNRIASIGRLFRPRRTAPASAATSNAETLAARDVPALFLWASARYRPQPYDGAVALLLSDDVLCSVDNVARAWKQLAPDLIIHPLRGSHLECITAHVDNLAQTMERCLEGNPATREKAASGVTVSGEFRS